MFYNYFSPEVIADSISDIPVEAITFLSYLDYQDIIKPFVCMDLAQGMTRREASIKYGITEGEARGLGLIIGRFGIRKRG